MVVCMVSVCVLIARAPVPLAAVKRPRQALLAHPNNYAYDSIQPQPTGIVNCHMIPHSCSVCELT